MNRMSNDPNLYSIELLISIVLPMVHVVAIPLSVLKHNPGGFSKIE
jgi:hypothetical protein